MNKILNVMEDIKQNIKDNEYKIIMDSFMEINKDKEKEKLEIKSSTQEEIIYLYTQKDFDDMAKIMVNLTLNNFFVFTDNENDVVWFDSIKTLTRNKLETHKIRFGGNKLETYILKIFEEKNLIKSGDLLIK